MSSFIDFATVIVFLVTMFDDSTQLVTVPRNEERSFFILKEDS